MRGKFDHDDRRPAACARFNEARALCAGSLDLSLSLPMTQNMLQ